MPTDIVRTKWNAFVTRQISLATSVADKIYWRGMYV